MKILIAQPSQERNLAQLEAEILKNPAVDIVLFPEGYLGDEEALDKACGISKKYEKMIITGYRNSNNKDRALIINKYGEIILERAKTPEDEILYAPSLINNDGISIGYLLCREILKGVDGLEGLAKDIDFISHPIGVGMFSDEQFEQWINEAKAIASKYKTMIIGTSHADGSYRNCGISLPIAYCIDENGEEVFISKCDIRTRIVDLKTKKVEIIDW